MLVVIEIKISWACCEQLQLGQRSLLQATPLSLSLSLLCQLSACLLPLHMYKYCTTTFILRSRRVRQIDLSRCVRCYAVMFIVYLCLHVSHI